ncbi:hypothetical protein BME24068_05496 [Burkholderia metallica]|nr:hypothetical protein BME24068_05496 [Burkholderia metallica]
MRGIGNETSLSVDRLRNATEQAVHRYDERSNFRRYIFGLDGVKLPLVALIDLGRQQNNRQKHLPHQIGDDHEKQRYEHKKRHHGS